MREDALPGLERVSVTLFRGVAGALDGVQVLVLDTDIDPDPSQSSATLQLAQADLMTVEAGDALPEPLGHWRVEAIVGDRVELVIR